MDNETIMNAINTVKEQVDKVEGQVGKLKDDYEENKNANTKTLTRIETQLTFIHTAVNNLTTTVAILNGKGGKLGEKVATTFIVGVIMLATGYFWSKLTGK